MRSKWLGGKGRLILAGGLALVFVCLLAGGVSAAGAPPLGTEDFRPTSTEGFSDRQNSWAWSMQWWHNRLWLGTNRAYGCVSAEIVHLIYPTYPYPPSDPDLLCATNPADLPLQAEIHSWSPGSNLWSTAFQSPNSIPNPKDPGKFLPPDIGFRTTAIYTDTAGIDHLWFGGVAAGAMGFGKLPPPRLIYTTDSATFTAVPQDQGTFLGSLTGDSFRGLTNYNGQLFVVNGGIQAAGPIIASRPGLDPAGGDDNWEQVSPPSLQYYEMVVFNGWLYAGTVDLVNGYSVVKTQAQGTAPYTFTTVVPPGAYLFPNPSAYAISLHVFDGRLYVGTTGPSELIRINADDTWDLVVGTPRQLPDGTWKYPLSGFGESYDNQFDDIIYRMGDHNGQLFIGTYDTAVRYKNTPQALQIQSEMGFDLFRTDDGRHMTAISTNGMGSIFDYSVRNFSDTPYGFFFGSLNEYYGLTLYQGIDSTAYRVAAPARVDVEVNHNQPILSWDPVPTATSYHVFRAPFDTVAVSATIGSPGSTFTFPSTYAEITPVTGIPDTVMVDDPVTSTNPTFIYYVVASDSAGSQSDPSNLALAPSFWPATTFTSLITSIGALNARGRFVSTATYATALQTIQLAQSQASTGDLFDAMTQLQSLDRSVVGGTIVLAPDLTDLDIDLARLERRLKLANAGLVSLSGLN